MPNADATVETPDFEQLARRLIVLIDSDGAAEDERPVDDLHRQAIANQLTVVAEQLRQVWNARGAADIAVIDDVAHTNQEPVADAIRSLDR